MDVDELYGLPLDRFVAERAALTRALREADRREEAAAVARLRKPSVAAWAVNQLVRSQARAIERLFKAGRGLRDAQTKVLAGRGRGPALRTAAERERTALDELVKVARGLLTSDGHELSETTLTRIGETLHAAALDDDARRLVRGGRLERELRHVGFGLGDVAVAPARRVEAQHAERERASARSAARASEAEARRRAARAARALAIAEERRERAASAIRDADQALDAARAEAEAAAAAHRAAQEQLDRI